MAEMTREAKEKDIQQACNAVIQWMRSQDIMIADGSYICALVAGYGLGEMETERKQLLRGIDVLTRALRRTALETWKAKRGNQWIRAGIDFMAISLFVATLLMWCALLTY